MIGSVQPAPGRDRIQRRRAKKQYAVEPGSYELLIGGASDNTPLRLAVEVR